MNFCKCCRLKKLKTENIHGTEKLSNADLKSTMLYVDLFSNLLASSCVGHIS